MIFLYVYLVLMVPTFWFAMRFFVEEFMVVEPDGLDGEALCEALFISAFASLLNPLVISVTLVYLSWVKWGQSQTSLIQSVFPPLKPVESKQEKAERENKEMRKRIQQLEREAGISVG